MGRADRVLAYVFVIVVLAALSAWTADRYGGASYWPSLLATLVAVVLAFEFERRRERRALERAEVSLMRRRETEARKRLLLLQEELAKNQISINDIVNGLMQHVPSGGFALIHPQLLDGTWSSSGERLGDLLAEYDLVARLSTFYGRLEELRWRIRYRTKAQDTAIDPMTQALAVQMRFEVAELIEKVQAEASAPEVRPVGVTHVASATARLGLITSLKAEKVPAESEGHD
jgi:hypothetical protein